MALLLSYAQQQAIRPISENNAGKYDLLAAEVESLEIDKLLGSAFYQEISANPTNYTDILDEHSFFRADNSSIKHKGLRYVIAYLNYSKYIGESYIVDTFSGFRTKVLQDSERLGSGDIKRLQQENREIAFNAFALIREFIELKPTIYTLWGSTSDKKISKPKFYGVKKTSL